jgi:F-type H+-transporting ATPase subunit epsilon
MRTFALHLESPTRYERIERVASFVAEDASGQFGLLAGHERFVTALVPGLARFRVAAQPWQYLALAGGIVHFAANELHVATNRYARDPDYGRMRSLLHEQLEAEEAALRELRTSVRRLEEAAFRRLYELARRGAAP